MAKKIEFTIPKGFNVPEGTDEGDTFEVSATFRLKDGRWGAMNESQDYTGHG